LPVALGQTAQAVPAAARHLTSIECRNWGPADSLHSSADDYQERLMSIRNLAQRSLLSSRRTPLTLHLVYHRTAIEEKFVRDEQCCCAFLRFDLARKDDGVRFLIAAPKEAAQAADILFGHFAPELTHQKN
jgi:hypothetical protein